MATNKIKIIKIKVMGDKSRSTEITEESMYVVSMFRADFLGQTRNGNHAKIVNEFFATSQGCKNKDGINN